LKEPPRSFGVPPSNQRRRRRSQSGIHLAHPTTSRDRPKPRLGLTTHAQILRMIPSNDSKEPHPDPRRTNGAKSGNKPWRPIALQQIRNLQAHAKDLEFRGPRIRGGKIVAWRRHPDITSCKSSSSSRRHREVSEAAPATAARLRGKALLSGPATEGRRSHWLTRELGFQNSKSSLYHVTHVGNEKRSRMAENNAVNEKIKPRYGAEYEAATLYYSSTIHSREKVETIKHQGTARLH